jgi:hypothetical protein
MVYTEFIDMLVVYLQIKFNMPNLTCSLSNTVRKFFVLILYGCLVIVNSTRTFPEQVLHIDTNLYNY